MLHNKDAQYQERLVQKRNRLCFRKKLVRQIEKAGRMCRLCAYEGFSMRLSVHYIKLSAVTVRDFYSMQRVNECMDSLAEAGIFFTMNSDSGYWQIESDEQGKSKTSFMSYNGLFRFAWVQFRLKNAPATIQRATDVAGPLVKGHSALVYLDGTAVFSKDVNNHMAPLRHVLMLLRDVGVRLKQKKFLCFV